jgi:hypothetical protein
MEEKPMNRLSCVLIAILSTLINLDQSYSKHPDNIKEPGTCSAVAAFKVYDCWWQDSLDKGCDGYTQFRRLWVDVDVDDGSTRTVYLKIYTKAASSLLWVLYCTTSTFVISGNSAGDSFWTSIGSPNPELSRDSHSFIVEAFEALSGTSVASRGPVDDADLLAQHFETSAGDAAGCPYAFGDCVWINSLDADGDGYAEEGRLWVDIRRQFLGGYEASLKVYCKVAGSSTYELYATTLSYYLYGVQNFLEIEVGGASRALERGTYDFKVELWAAGNYKAVLTRLPEDDTDLRNQRFEPSVASGVEDEELLPLTFRLEQNYPNPFNPTTVVSCQLPVAGYLRIAVFNILGQEIAVLADEPKAPGIYQMRWDASGLPSGVYVCRMTAGNVVETMKMILAR